jgi:hypothetical protein
MGKAKDLSAPLRIQETAFRQSVNKVYRTGAAAFISGGDKTNYCHLDVVVLLTNKWQGSESQITERS